MSADHTITAERVHELVTANRVIRSPEHHADRSGLHWGGDIIPALMGLFHVHKNPQDGRGGWAGFAVVPENYDPQYAKEWDDDAFRVDFDLIHGPGSSDETLVVTAMYARKADASGRTIADADFGKIDLPEERPSDDEWTERVKEYEAVRRDDESDDASAVYAFIESLSGWKRAAARRIDEIVEREAPAVRRAVKWHQPFYGLDGQGWIVAISPLSKKLKLTFMAGTSLNPVPPGGKRDDSRWVDIDSVEALDEDLISSWVRQAATLPGWGGD